MMIDFEGMTDKELVQYLMNVTAWNQTEVAQQLYVTHPQVSRVLSEQQRLRPKIRKLVVMLIQQHEAGS